DAVAYFLTHGAGVPAEVVDQMRGAPVWPAFEAVAHTLPYDAAVMGDTIFGSPLPAGRWAQVAVPTLALDGGAGPTHMPPGAEAVGNALPNAQRRTLEGQDHGPAPEVLAPALAEFFGGRNP